MPQFIVAALDPGGRNISGAQTAQSTAPSRHRLRRFLLLTAGTGSLYVTYRLLLAPADQTPRPAKNWQGKGVDKQDTVSYKLRTLTFVITDKNEPF
ncbi:hypothetical protein ACOMHN_061660 [Nucella lapillus]